MLEFLGREILHYRRMAHVNLVPNTPLGDACNCVGGKR